MTYETWDYVFEALIMLYCYVCIWLRVCYVVTLALILWRICWMYYSKYVSNFIVLDIYLIIFYYLLCLAVFFLYIFSPSWLLPLPAMPSAIFLWRIFGLPPWATIRYWQLCFKGDNPTWPKWEADHKAMDKERYHEMRIGRKDG